MNTPWRIQMLGDLCLTRDGRLISRFKRQQAAILLARLAYRAGSPHTRDELMELLWPETDPLDGRPKLRVALNSLRRQLEPSDVPPGAVLVATRDIVRINPHTVCTDVADFEAAQLAAKNALAADEKITNLEEAIRIYRGDLLPRFDDEWVSVERSNLQACFFSVLDSLVSLVDERGEISRAIPALQHALRLDPFREETHYALIRAYADTGQVSTARRQHQLLEKLLKDDLGAGASEARRLRAPTRVVEHPRVVEEPRGPHERRPSISSETFRAPGRPPYDEPPDISVAVVSTPIDIDPQTQRTRLPVRFTRFFGREEEMDRLRSMLAPATPHVALRNRLVTLTGPAGCGKTRLAIEISELLAPAYHDAVWFVSLVKVAHASEIPHAIAQSLGLRLLPNGDPIGQIAAFLRRQTSLLILDSYEHLVASGSHVVETLLRRNARVVCVVTSRQRLAVADEREVRVSPMAVPGEQDDLDALMDFPCVQLFVDRAQSADPDFQLTPRNAASISHLCRYLEGMPFSLELAASRARVVTPSRMLQGIKQSAERFAGHTPRRAEPMSSHSSTWSAIAWSYELLPPDVRQFFVRLSVFQGAWSAAAAGRICEELQALDYLDRLRVYTLISSEGKGEEMAFRMNETVRDFARAQVEPEERRVLARRHAYYYVQLIGGTPGSSIDIADSSGGALDLFENLSAALEWCEESGEYDWQVRLVLGLLPCWGHLGQFSKGRQKCERVMSGDVELPAPIRARLLLGAAILTEAEGSEGPTRDLFDRSMPSDDQPEAPDGVAAALRVMRSLSHGREDDLLPIALLLESLSVIPAAEERPEIGEALMWIENPHAGHGGASAAREHYRAGLNILREWGATRVVAYLLYCAGHAIHSRGDFGVAAERFYDSLALWREMSDSIGAAACLHGLAVVEMDQGNDAAAMFLLEISRDLFQKAGQPDGAAAVDFAAGDVAYRQGGFADARRLLDRCLAFWRERKLDRRVAAVLRLSSMVAVKSGELGAAASLGEESLALYKKTGSRSGLSSAHIALARIAVLHGDPERAMELAREGLSYAIDSGDRRQLIEAVESVAQVLAVRAGAAGSAARLLAAAAAARQESNCSLSDCDKKDHELAVSRLLDTLSSSVFSSVWEQGRKMSLEQMVAFATAAAIAPAGPDADIRLPWVQ